MAEQVTAWKTSNGVLFENEQDALDYEEYLTYKETNFADLIQELNTYLRNYSVKHPVTGEILSIFAIDSESPYVNRALISTDFVRCKNLDPVKVSALQNIANNYKVYNLQIPHWALEEE